MSTYYIKKGRKYVPIAEDRTWDTIPLGYHVVCVKPGLTSWKFRVSPELATFEAASQIAKEAMLERMMKVNEMKISPKHYPEYLRPKLEKAYKAWKDIMGVDIPLSFQGVSMSDVIEAGIDAVKEEQNIKKEAGPTQLDLFNK